MIASRSVGPDVAVLAPLRSDHAGVMADETLFGLTGEGAQPALVRVVQHAELGFHERRRENTIETDAKRGR